MILALQVVVDGTGIVQGNPAACSLVRKGNQPENLLLSWGIVPVLVFFQPQDLEIYRFDIFSTLKSCNILRTTIVIPASIIIPATIFLSQAVDPFVL